MESATTTAWSATDRRSHTAATWGRPRSCFAPLTHRATGRPRATRSCSTASRKHPHQPDVLGLRRYGGGNRIKSLVVEPKGSESHPARRVLLVWQVVLIANARALQTTLLTPLAVRLAAGLPRRATRLVPTLSPDRIEPRSHKRVVPGLGGSPDHQGVSANPTDRLLPRL